MKTNLTKRANLFGNVFRSILPLIHMLDDVPFVSLTAAVAGDDGNSLADCDLSAIDLPPGFKMEDRCGLRTLCELVLEMAKRSPLLALLPETMEGVNRIEFVGALILYSMEEPCGLYRLITNPLNVHGVRSKAALRCQLRYLKLLTVALQIVPKDCEYWYTGVIYRGVSTEGDAALQQKYENFKDDFKPGTQLVFAAPATATKVPSTAGQFTKGFQFVFQGDRPDRGPGGVMLKAGDLSVYEEEEEVLLVSPSTFTVVAATKVQEIVVVTLQVRFNVLNVQEAGSKTTAARASVFSPMSSSRSPRHLPRTRCGSSSAPCDKFPNSR